MQELIDRLKAIEQELSQADEPELVDELRVDQVDEPEPEPDQVDEPELVDDVEPVDESTTAEGEFVAARTAMMDYARECENDRRERDERLRELVATVEAKRVAFQSAKLMESDEYHQQLVQEREVKAGG